MNEKSVQIAFMCPIIYVTFQLCLFIQGSALLLGVSERKKAISFKLKFKSQGLKILLNIHRNITTQFQVLGWPMHKLKSKEYTWIGFLQLKNQVKTNLIILSFLLFTQFFSVSFSCPKTRLKFYLSTSTNSKN